jgi:enamine deaminase RidA (YjgF/YER057c/UK114 family)
MRTTRSNPDTVAAPIGSYSQSVRVETADATWIYVSGQIAVDLDDELVAPNDLPAQTQQVYENLRAVLEAHGATFGVVV